VSLSTTVLPLGFGLSAILGFSTAAADEKPAPAPRPPARLYTNEDLDRVRPFRDQTGVQSVPAVAPDDRPAPARADERPRGRGEDYWRREAARVRERVRAIEAQAAAVQAQIVERAEEGRLFARRRRSGSSSSPRAEATLRAKLATLEGRMRQIEDDLADRARRDGALPGWLR
jgi:hypothetical protein